MSIEEMKSRGINPVARQLQSAVPIWKDGNYAKFYALLRKLPGDKEEIKRQLVLQYTCYRTDSLKEITYGEYKNICRRMEEMIHENGHNDAARDDLRRQRSSALHQMQKMGVDTTDWNRINALCKDLRIAGKLFAQMTAEELVAMTIKLRTIERKGGIRPFEEAGTTAVVVPIR